MANKDHAYNKERKPYDDSKKKPWKRDEEHAEKPNEEDDVDGLTLEEFKA